MATIQDYLEAAKGAIVSGAFERAMVLCDYLLQRYPKHLEAHCLLAEAQRELGETKCAEDLFLRVLSADPGRLIARWALSIMHEERGERDAALAHLRIALEVTPDHAELRNEVVKLGGARAKPTLGGLAHLYLRGGLFDRAVAEFRAALAREPRRLDLLTGLAEALWRGGRDDEAAEVCHAILADSPDCLKALLIAAFVAATRKKQPSDAETRLWQAAHALDPEHQLAQQLAAEVGVALSAEWWALMPAPPALPELDSDQLSPDSPPMAEPATTLTAAPGVTQPAEPAAEWQEGATGPLADVAARGAFWPPTLPADGLPAAEVEDESLPCEPELEEVARRMDEAARPVSAPVVVPLPTSEPLASQKEQPSATMVGEDEVGTTADTWLDRTIMPDSSPAVAAESAAAEHGEPLIAEGEWGEWADLLHEEITLDPGAEARLSAALAELQMPQEAAAAGSTTAGATDAAARAAPAAPGLAAVDLTPAPSATLQPDSPGAAPAPADPETRLSLARRYQEAGQTGAALAEYRTLLKVAPQVSGAIADALRELLRTAPNHPDAHRALGDAYMKLGRFQQAIDEYNQALSLERVAR